MVLDLLSLTEEAAMWQKIAFAKPEDVLVQLLENFGFPEYAFECVVRERNVVMRTCLILAVDECVDGLMHDSRKVKGNCHIEARRSLGVWSAAERYQ